MSNYTIKGMVIRKTNFSENDVIFDVLTSEGKILGFFGRGARKLKSKLSGVLQLGFVLNIEYKEGKNLHYPIEITIASEHIFSFFTRSLSLMRAYTDIIAITRTVSKDLEDCEIFTAVLSTFHKLENREDPLEVYAYFLNEILSIIGVDSQLRCYFTGECIAEPEFFYVASTNKVIAKSRRPNSIDAELISLDSVFTKQYLQKLILEHVSSRLKLTF